MEIRHSALVDVMSVTVDGDPSEAVFPVPDLTSARVVDCEVLVVGGGTGGVAAAISACHRGRRVHLVEETDWIGGQLTSQGVSALDEHAFIEEVGGTETYYRLRRTIRDHYRAFTNLLDRSPLLNPGNCWVTSLAFEPSVAVAALTSMLQPFLESGLLTMHLRTKAAAVDVEGDHILSVATVGLESGHRLRFRAQLFIDATELGDLLPLAGAEYCVGAESVAETGEAHAQPDEPKPRCVQSFTYVLALERRPRGESHVIDRPTRYEFFRSSQPYSLTIEVHGGEIYGEHSGRLSYKVFETMPDTKGSLWTYRRLIDSSQFGSEFPADVSIVNWPGNDYREASIIDRPAAEVAAALQDAKRASLGFLYWLQTEAPAEGGRLGAPELTLRPDVMGTPDGLGKHPYVRESRRIKALRTVVEQDVSIQYQHDDTAAPFNDSVGIGWYPIDIHTAGPDDVGVSCRTRPFQIPLGALIPIRVRNLIAAAKNIGTTHITNGCFRLHPVEWNIGEAAGALAAFSLDHAQSPAAVHRDAELLSEFQRSLQRDGVRISWPAVSPAGGMGPPRV